MKTTYSLFLVMFLALNCFSQQEETQKGTVNPHLLKAITTYMDTFNEIPNKCHSKPYYEVSFSKSGTKISFVISAFLGKPGLPPPLPPLLLREREDTIAFKLVGYTFINKCPVVFYDLDGSDGYSMYDPLSLSKDVCEVFQNIPDSCANVFYPESWLYGFNAGKVFLEVKIPGCYIK